MRHFLTFTGLLATAVAGVLTTGYPTIAIAAPTPIPGGAGQLAGVSGGLSSTLFNGKLRIRKMQLRASTAAEDTPDEEGLQGSRYYARMLLRRGTIRARSGSGVRRSATPSSRKPSSTSKRV